MLDWKIRLLRSVFVWFSTIFHGPLEQEHLLVCQLENSEPVRQSGQWIIWSSSCPPSPPHPPPPPSCTGVRPASSHWESLPVLSHCCALTSCLSWLLFTSSTESLPVGFTQCNTHAQQGAFPKLNFRFCLSNFSNSCCKCLWDGERYLRPPCVTFIFYHWVNNMAAAQRRKQLLTFTPVTLNEFLLCIFGVFCRVLVM